ncbi:MAG: hypothetical protein KAU01_12360 [Candidatus Cloacimonetes bacterium]|nr:hypothetical protein [Candidatus Cloacimonadota bacterium]
MRKKKFVFIIFMIIILMVMIGCAGMSFIKDLSPVDKTFTINKNKEVIYENVLIWLATNFDGYKIKYQNLNTGKIIVRNLHSQVPSGIFLKLYQCSMIIDIRDNYIHLVFNDLNGYDDTHIFHQKLAEKLNDYLNDVGK